MGVSTSANHAGGDHEVAVQALNRELQDKGFLLTSTEDIISRARGGYNGAAGGYNQSLVVFPANIVANMFGFKPMPFFEVDSAAERVAPQVKF